MGYTEVKITAEVEEVRHLFYYSDKKKVARRGNVY